MPRELHVKLRILITEAIKFANSPLYRDEKIRKINQGKYLVSMKG